MNILPETHYLLLQAHLSDSISNESTRSLGCIKSKCFLVSVTNVGFLGVSKTNRARKLGASKEHLPPTAHVVGPNSNSPNKTISSAERQRHCMQRRVPLFSFKSPVTSTRELQEEKKQPVSDSGFHSANTFSLAAGK